MRKLRIFLTNPYLVIFIAFTITLTSCGSHRKSIYFDRFSGEELFKGIILGSGKVFEMAPELSVNNRIIDIIEDPIELSRIHAMHDYIISKINSDNPDFFTKFKLTIESGDHVNISNSISEGIRLSSNIIQVDILNQSAENPRKLLDNVSSKLKDNKSMQIISKELEKDKDHYDSKVVKQELKKLQMENGALSSSLKKLDSPVMASAETLLLIVVVVVVVLLWVAKNDGGQTDPANGGFEKDEFINEVALHFKGPEQVRNKEISLR